MKICPKCNTSNKDSTLICKSCRASISGVKTIDKSQVARDFLLNEEKRKLKKRIIKITSLVIIVIIYLLLFIKASSKEDFISVTIGSILITTMGYLNIFHPKFLFMIKHIFTIQNIDDVELTDLYVFICMVSGIILTIAGIVLMFMWAIG